MWESSISSASLAILRIGISANFVVRARPQGRRLHFPTTIHEQDLLGHAGVGVACRPRPMCTQGFAGVPRID